MHCNSLFPQNVKLRCLKDLENWAKILFEYLDGINNFWHQNRNFQNSFFFSSQNGLLNLKFLGLCYKTLNGRNLVPKSSVYIASNFHPSLIFDGKTLR